jgi:hypothetical protein
MLWQENGVSLVALKIIAKIRDNGERRQRQADKEFKPREHVGHGAYRVFYFREATAHESIACQVHSSSTSTRNRLARLRGRASLDLAYVAHMMDRISGVQIGPVLRAWL